MKRKRLRISLTLVTAVLVFIIAALAGSSLWVLRRMHNQAAHATAAKAVLDQGRLIAAYLADEPAVRRTGETTDWTAFSRLVHSLYTVENGLQYVSVIRDGIVVFHEQTRSLDASEEPARPTRPPAAGVRLSRKLISAGIGDLPVVTFTIEFEDKDGAPGHIEVALRRDTVGREEGAAATAIASMFKVSLATIVVSFAVCIVLVVQMMRREMQREKLRRDEEHLAFSGVLANGIVHDFRNPMSSVRLDVQMLQKETTRGEACRLLRVAELADRVRNTVDRMDKVFQEFLYLSKPLSDAPETVDLGLCVRDALEMLVPRFEQAEVKSKADLPAAGPLATAHPLSVRRAIINVLLNAEQASPKGSTVEVRAFTEGRRAIVEILDLGPGIPKLERKRIFEMFFSTRPGGTGLGLFLAKTAIEKSGGNITATSPPEGGSCFRIALPLARQEPAHGTDTHE